MQMVWDLKAYQEMNVKIILSKGNNFEDVEWIEVFHTGVRLLLFPMYISVHLLKYLHLLALKRKQTP
jgi:hypothetical protein